MPPTKSVKVELGGKRRPLRYTNRALVRLEDEAGVTVGEVALKTAQGSLRSISTLVWAGLIHDWPEVTIEQVIDLIDLRRLDEINAALEDALTAALGKPASNGGPPDENPPTAD